MIFVSIHSFSTVINQGRSNWDSSWRIAWKGITIGTGLFQSVMKWHSSAPIWLAKALSDPVTLRLLLARCQSIQDRCRFSQEGPSPKTQNLRTISHLRDVFRSSWDCLGSWHWKGRYQRFDESWGLSINYCFGYGGRGRGTWLPDSTKRLAVMWVWALPSGHWGQIWSSE